MTEIKEGTISREVKGHVFLIGVHRATKMNAFTWEMLMDLSRAFGEYEKDQNMRCAVLYADGSHFTAGLDLGDVAPHVAKGELFIPEGDIDPWAVHGRMLSKPLVIAVQGRCYTLGTELSLAADIVVAATDTRFAQLEVKRGIFPFGGGTIRLARTAGWGNAMRYLLTGDEFDVNDAYRFGLVQEITEPGQQFAKALEIAEKIAAQAPLAVQATLALAKTAANEGFAAGVREIMPRLLKIMKTEDAAEGVMSLIERRPANFKGR
ncbi:MAG TPA: crotonase/enoyl-CoA hydratase family protein [Syntrophales bacterium]|jgi:enoyl-CoA hydratase/carnithine racemase|nr:crotonase/enoyl-CoA hydratase family protein [Syntrophales bacterium]HON22401.1 crotonase/enoyl-CoA hydratase family protein [Syntrophales bacterium]HOU77163.1 crotonase/enoyl-CoA hydratase family protein [Syntrophales bacterium]HPC32072.1 crotonase/enoyl-CoA hydratase family protein [Syntrophales bacterium]HQG35217.1 crotonase/enoyl-CoA hydratase family protein [Syntrophales bacterium]